MSAQGVPRRALLSSSTLALVAGAAGLAATAGAADVVLLGSDVGPDDDAELLQVCAAFDAIEARMNALDGDRDEALMEGLAGQQAPLLDRMCDLCACTLAGVRARAATLALYAPDLLEPFGDYVDNRMVAALLRDLTAGGVA